ncbi:phasin [Mesorhizobium sangaii]|uniref:Phasin n=1 Tax=Mesorhizobium sangaii TaxID=505389 RepID=A0A841P0L8_9HYPH|nr:phasin [Mesorhizobium sangaii]MBB6408864.1 phasin [Mesorhizobium sangaii]
MSKTTEKTAEFIENAYPAFDASKAIEQVSAFTEKGVEQSKEVLAKFKADSETTQKALETSFASAKAASSNLSLKTIAVLRANTEAAFSHFEALIAVKSPSEFVELQAAFVRKQVESAVEQTRELQAVTTKAVEDVSKPIKSAFEKAVKDLKVA